MDSNEIENAPRERIVYIVTSMAGPESVWDDPELALQAYAELTDPGIIVTRSLNSRIDSAAVEEARKSVVNEAIGRSIRTELI